MSDTTDSTPLFNPFTETRETRVVRFCQSWRSGSLPGSGAPVQWNRGEVAAFPTTVAAALVHQKIAEFVQEVS